MYTQQDTTEDIIALNRGHNPLFNTTAIAPFIILGISRL